MTLAWAGDAPLLLCPGAGSCAIESPRRELAPALCAGRPVATVPGLLAALFSLCGMAHRLCATLALAAAEQGEAPPVAAASRAALADATRRDQALRLGLDWPRRLPGAVAQPWVTALPAEPAAATRWLEQALLGEPAAGWLARHGADTEAVARWSARGDTALARLLAAQRPATAALRLPAQPLQLLDRPEATLPLLAQRMAGEPGFCLRPHWQQGVPETGPWTRHARPLAVRSAWDRLAARVIDLAALCCDDAPPLSLGALALGERGAIAWCEMARGLLLHWVRLEPGEARVRDYRVLAPTEWNFHPQGVLAAALAAAPAADDVARLAVALDPCVDFAVRPAREAAHA
ncbi:MAG: hypothetical protein DI603_10045 [Roseateles depolymerans]|uniref:Hydrogenase formation protein n=1 Tax=Roseateles depolymerans TaxID=76731 RepID=A0A2W5DT58_9BURK|nr:MAG: hypothetical protein DI603_10045 [Roseateles depolymerans]